jgi:hypothetical protein
LGADPQVHPATASRLLAIWYQAVVSGNKHLKKQEKAQSFYHANQPINCDDIKPISGLLKAPMIRFDQGKI